MVSPQNSRMPLLLLLCLLAPVANAQTFSYDGNRWYEIEVSIFSNSNENAGAGNELVIPDKIKLSYPEPIRQLQTAVSTYMVPFEEEAAIGLPAPEPVQELPQEEKTEVIGPPGPPLQNAFRITDFSRDPYIALGDEAAEFTAYNRNIANSPQHRLLLHAVWRQPVMNLVQATALFVSGGDQYGRHHELEGSLRFSYNVNRVDVEANLWLAEFSAFPVGNGEGMRWQLPAPPFQAGETSLTLDLPVTELSYMNQVRPMISNELHYLDHPDLGVLVQIRPYELPQPTNLSFE